MNVQIPEIGLVQFPDSMSPEQVASIIRTKLIPEFQQSKQIAAIPPMTGQGQNALAPQPNFNNGGTHQMPSAPMVNNVPVAEVPPLPQVAPPVFNAPKPLAGVPSNPTLPLVPSSALPLDPYLQAQFGAGGVTKAGQIVAGKVNDGGNSSDFLAAGTGAVLRGLSKLANSKVANTLQKVVEYPEKNIQSIDQSNPYAAATARTSLGIAEMAATTIPIVKGFGLLNKVSPLVAKVVGGAIAAPGIGHGLGVLSPWSGASGYERGMAANEVMVNTVFGALPFLMANTVASLATKGAFKRGTADEAALNSVRNKPAAEWTPVEKVFWTGTDPALHGITPADVAAYAQANNLPYTPHTSNPVPTSPSKPAARPVVPPVAEPAAVDPTRPLGLGFQTPEGKPVPAPAGQTAPVASAPAPAPAPVLAGPTTADSLENRIKEVLGRLAPDAPEAIQLVLRKNLSGEVMSANEQGLFDAFMRLISAPAQNNLQHPPNANPAPVQPATPKPVIRHPLVEHALNWVRQNHPDMVPLLANIQIVQGDAENRNAATLGTHDDNGRITISAFPQGHPLDNPANYVEAIAHEAAHQHQLVNGGEHFPDKLPTDFAYTVGNLAKQQFLNHVSQQKQPVTQNANPGSQPAVAQPQPQAAVQGQGGVSQVQGQAVPVQGQAQAQVQTAQPRQVPEAPQGKVPGNVSGGQGSAGQGNVPVNGGEGVVFHDLLRTTYGVINRLPASNPIRKSAEVAARIGMAAKTPEQFDLATKELAKYAQDAATELRRLNPQHEQPAVALEQALDAYVKQGSVASAKPVAPAKSALPAASKPMKAVKDVSITGMNPDAPLADFSAVTDNADGTQTVAGKLRTDDKAIRRRLSASGYMGGLVETSMKEWVQNLFDAVKEALYKGHIKKGLIDITCDEANRTLTFKDNGVGMDLDTVEHAFFTVGGTKKDLPPHLRSGGLGVAKLQTMMNCDLFYLETVKDGQKIVCDTTGMDIDDSNFKLQLSKTSEPNGTTVRIKFPESIMDVNGEKQAIYFYSSAHSYDALNRPLIVPEGMDIEVRFNGEKVDFAQHVPPKWPGAHARWGDIEIYVSEQPNNNKPKHTVLSSGIYQFNVNLMKNDRELLPFDVVLNFLPNIGTESMLYPFNNTREDFRPTILPDIKALYAYLARIGLAADEEVAKKAFAVIEPLHHVDATGKLPIAARVAMLKAANEQTKLPEKTQEKPKPVPVQISAQGVMTTDGKPLVVTAKDTNTGKTKLVNIEKAVKVPTKNPNESKTDTNEILGGYTTTLNVEKEIELRKSVNLKSFDDSVPQYHNNTTGDYKAVPGAMEYFTQMASVMFDAMQWAKKNVYASYFPAGTKYFAGVSIDKEYGGVHTNYPFKGIFINPCHIPWQLRTVNGLAHYWTHIIIHELAHTRQKNEGAGFTYEMSVFDGLMGEKGYKEQLFQTVRNIISQNIETINKVREIYDNSRTTNIAKSLKQQDAEHGNSIGTRTGSVSGDGDAEQGIQNEALRRDDSEGGVGENEEPLANFASNKGLGSVHGEDETGGADEGNLHGVNRRLNKERAARGDINEPPPGEVGSPESIVERGRKLLEEGADPVKVLTAALKLKTPPADAIAITRAHGEKLYKAAVDAFEKYGRNSPEYKKAAKADNAWAQRIKPLATEAGEAMRALQGGTDVEDGTFHGMAVAYFESTGKEFTEAQATQAEVFDDKIKQHTMRIEDELQRVKDELAKHLQQRKSEGGVEGEGTASHMAAAMPKNTNPTTTSAPDIDIDVSARATAQKRRETESDKVWAYAKANYFEHIADFDFDEVAHGISMGTGIPHAKVVKILTSVRNIKVATDAMYRDMDARRKLRNSAKQWLLNQNIPQLAKIYRFIPRVFFMDKVFGHGTVGMVTHAGMNFYDVDAWRTYFPAFIRQYLLAFSTVKHEQWIHEQTRKPNFIMWKRAGLKCDPYQYADDYQNAAIKAAFGKFNISKLAGADGFDALKEFRINYANQLWNAYPPGRRQKILEDGQVVTNMTLASDIADRVNHATGIVRRTFRQWASDAFFAPRLEASRWALMIADPARAAGIAANWKNATEDERDFARAEVKQKARLMAMYFGLLAINSAILSMTDSKSKVNWNNPMRADFLGFKIAGHNVGVVGPLLGIVRYLSKVLHSAFASDRTNYEQLTTRGRQMGQISWDYLRGKASPMTQFGLDNLTQETAVHDVVPWSKDKPAKGHKTEAAGEYLAITFSPIPISEGLKETWHDMGVPREQQEKWLSYIKGFAVAVPAGLTGARISPEYEEVVTEKKQPNPFKMQGLPNFNKPPKF